VLVDASVWTAVVDPRDRFHGAARSLVLDFQGPLAALDLTFYEIANAVGVKQGLFDQARYMGELVSRRCGDRIIKVDTSLLGSVCDIAAEHGLTAYDAAYVAAAQRHDWTLVSADIADLVSKGLAVAPDAADYP
jgi:predicted nucleic acid-binding protein